MLGPDNSMRFCSFSLVRPIEMKPKAASRCVTVLLVVFVVVFELGGALPDERTLEGTIAFTTVGRSHYAFDIYAVSLLDNRDNLEEEMLTDGISVNYNGHFAAIQDFSHGLGVRAEGEEVLVFVSERNGAPQIYFDTKSMEPQLMFQKDGIWLDKRVSMEDRPSMVGSRIVYVSTRQSSGTARQSWAAVYSTHLHTGETRRLSPAGVADLSPSVSPSGEWVMVSSFEEAGWHGQVHDLQTDLYVFHASDGSNRQLVVKNGGWPSWADDRTVFFHRKSEDGWWSIYRVSLPESLKGSWRDYLTVDRITPPGLHAFTPAASRSGKWVAAATRRPDTQYRHIEIFDLGSESFVEITKGISPQSHHFNPFVSPNSERIGYHRCRGGFAEDMGSSGVPVLEHVKSPLPGISMFRIDGDFPSFSPDGTLIAYISRERDAVYVMKIDGSPRRKIFSGPVFGLAWDWKRNDVIYTSHGPAFASLNATVDIIALNASCTASEGGPDSNPSSYKKLTKEGSNAFPSPSPDGRFVAFRSGRSGYKNIYIMDSYRGEEGSLQQITQGPWTDTMCTWSPDGNWIAFSSDRDDPGSDSFSLFLIHPNGTGLRKVFSSGTSGMVNHPWFSPDSKSLIFTSDYVGVSAEPVTVPHQFGPFGEIFMAKIDGSDVQRLTHNAYEDGTSSWGRVFISASDFAGESGSPDCDFEDDRWLNGTVMLARQSTYYNNKYRANTR